MPKSPSAFVGSAGFRIYFLRYWKYSRIVPNDKKFQLGICRRLAEICRSAYYMLGAISNGMVTGLSPDQ